MKLLHNLIESYIENYIGLRLEKIEIINNIVQQYNCTTILIV